MEDQQHLQPGTALGQYRLLRRLGTGNFGAVYLAEDHYRQVQVAIKVLQAPLAHPENFKNFINEARTMRLRHPHIIQVLDFGVHRDNRPYLVMEYIPGGTLRQRHARGIQLPLPVILTYTSQLASALQYAHEMQIIHRDVKPENVLLRSDGSLLLGDFGIAKVLEQTALLNSTLPAGTPAYMAPEQSQGRPTFASDQYSLAIMVYEWLTGRRPFQGSAMEVLLQHYLAEPPRLSTPGSNRAAPIEQVLFKALAKTPEERFSTVRTFAEALRESTNMGAVDVSTTPVHFTATPQTREVASKHEAPSITREARSIFKQRPILRRVVLGGLVAILLLSTGLGAFFALAQQRKMLALSMTATAQDAPFATATAAANAYDTAAAKNGIQFGFDANHSGYNPYERQLSLLTVPHLKEAWATRTGGGIEDTPAVVGGVIYVGSFDHRLYAFSTTRCGQSSCQPLWTALTGDSIFSSPAVANGVVYVSSSDFKLYAFAANGCGHSTCGPLWTASSFHNIFPLSTPTVANGIVYASSVDGRLYAFDAQGCGHATCQPLWTSLTSDIDANKVPAIEHGVVYVGSDDGNLYAFNAHGCGQATCQPLWRGITDGSFVEIPSVVNGYVYVSTSNLKLFVFAATCGHATCQPLWTSYTGITVGSISAVANGILYIGTTTGNLAAFTATGCGEPSCQPQWNATLGGPADFPPVVANSVVYIDAGDKLFALNANGCGQFVCIPLWSTIVGDSISCSPVVANGVVYIGNNAGQLYAFQAY